MNTLLNALTEALLHRTFVDHLRTMWPHGNQHVPGLIEGIAASAPRVFAKYGINNQLIIAHMMGQFSEECNGGLEMVENMNYSAERLMVVWPTRFPNLPMAQHYAHNPRMIADVAYGGRLGNDPPPSDDGWNYRGKGLAQTTGKENYARLKDACGLDVLAHPELLVRPDTALECAVADYVKICGCLPYAAADDTQNETLHLNGGLNGLSIRIDWIARWKQELGV